MLFQPTDSPKPYLTYPSSYAKRLKTATSLATKELFQKNQTNSDQIPDIEIEHPSDPSHGDFSTNTALKLARTLRKSPRDIAKEIIQLLQKDVTISFLKSIEVAGGGFINFTLKTSELVALLKDIQEQKKSYGNTSSFEGKTILIEHTQPNSHKAMHVGHFRNSFLAMAELRLYKAIGFDVISVDYAGDIGPNVAKCLYNLDINELENEPSLRKRIKIMQTSYVKTNGEMKEDTELQEKIKQDSKAMYLETNPELTSKWKKTFRMSFEDQKRVFERIGTRFDKYYWESAVWKEGLDLVESHVGNIFEESNGAIIFPGEKYGLHTRVFKTQHGTAPYEAKDLGLSQAKLRDFDFDISVIQTGNEQKEYFNVILKVLELLFPEQKGKFSNITYGMVNLTTGKMSSREGNVIWAEDLLDELIERAKQELLSRHDDIDEQKANSIATDIGLGAFKYAMLKYDPKSDIALDPNQSLQTTGNNGPYLQYVAVRIQSIIDKANNESITMKGWENIDESKISPNELTLMRKLSLLPEIIIKSAIEYKPNTLAQYLFEVAQSFNTVYLSSPILREEDPDLQSFRLALSISTLQVLTNGLHLLGINTPEKM